VYHKIKFIDSQTLEVLNSIHVQPQRKTKHNEAVKARFDTVLVNDGTGKPVGIKGYCIDQVQAVFLLPKHIRTQYPI
jgi:hypothetical protein